MYVCSSELLAHSWLECCHSGLLLLSSSIILHQETVSSLSPTVCPASTGPTWKWILLPTRLFLLTQPITIVLIMSLEHWKCVTVFFTQCYGTQSALSCVSQSGRRRRCHRTVTWATLHSRKREVLRHWFYNSVSAINGKLWIMVEKDHHTGVHYKWAPSEICPNYVFSKSSKIRWILVSRLNQLHSYS